MTEKRKHGFHPAFLYTVFCSVLLLGGALFVLSLKGHSSAAAPMSPDGSSETETADGPSSDTTPYLIEVNVTPSPVPLKMTRTVKETVVPPLPRATREPVVPTSAALPVIRGILNDMADGKDDDAGEKLEKLLETDPPAGRQWRELIDYWHETEKDDFIRKERLPSDLPQDNSLCIVVFGYKLSDHGNMQAELIGRLNVALTCANQYPNAYILVTGGGTADRKKKVTEAEKMAEWLKKNGVSSKRILMEDDSKSTNENIKFTYTLLSRDHPEVTSIAVVTSDYHVPRCCLFYTARFMQKGSPLSVVANASYVTGPTLRRESRKMLADGVKRLMEVD